MLSSSLRTSMSERCSSDQTERELTVLLNLRDAAQVVDRGVGDALMARRERGEADGLGGGLDGRARAHAHARVEGAHTRLALVGGCGGRRLRAHTACRSHTRCATINDNCVRTVLHHSMHTCIRRRRLLPSVFCDFCRLNSCSK